MRSQFIAVLAVASLGCATAQEPGFEFERWCEAVSAIVCDAEGCHITESAERVTIAFNVERNGELCIDSACNPFNVIPSGPDRFGGSLAVESGAYAGQWQFIVAGNRRSFVLVHPVDIGVEGWSGHCGVNS
jgi:hypothetical protein